MKLNEIKRIFELDDSPLGDSLRALGIQFSRSENGEPEADVDSDLFELVNKSILSTRPQQLSDAAIKTILTSDKTKAMYEKGLENLSKILAKIENNFSVDVSQSEQIAKVLGTPEAAKTIIEAAKKDTAGVHANLKYIQDLIDKKRSMIFESITRRSSATTFPSTIAKDISTRTDPAEVKRELILFTMLIDVLQSNTKAIEVKLS